MERAENSVNSVSYIGQLMLTMLAFRPGAKMQGGGMCSSLRNEAGESGLQLWPVQALQVVLYLM